MSSPLTRIVTILPKGEGFSARRFGAIALCVRDFTQTSRFGKETLVLGGLTEDGFQGLRYVRSGPARWYENRTSAYARNCAKAIEESGAQLAEIHNRPLLLKKIAREVRCKLALHLHNDPQEMRETHTPEEREGLLDLCDGIYCVSDYIRGRFLDGLAAEAGNKVTTVHNGIAIPERLQEKERTILFAGRMTEGKGARLLAEALRIALPALPHWRAQFIGSRRHEAGRPLTPHEKEINDALAPLGSQVTVTGFLPHEETLAAFARASIAVVPSVWAEPFGRTVIEAMSQGCAVISSGTGGLREVTGDAALTLPAMTPEALAHAITTLAEDEALRDSYVRLARERAAYFAIENRVKTLDEARGRILSKGSRHAA